MRIVRHAPRAATAGLLAAAIALGLVTGGLARGQDEAPAGAEPEPLDAIPTDVEIPNDIDLLRAPPFDMLTLLDGVTIRVDPVSPRPLPSMEELEANRTKNSRVERIGGIMVGRAPEVKKDPRDEAIIVHTLDGEPRDYYLKYVSIKKSEYYEDILLADAIRRARTGDFDRAFELTLIVEARDPDWPGLHATADRLLFMEGQWAMDRNDVDNGLRILGALYENRPDYPELAGLLAKAYAGRVDAAINEGAYALGRRVLGELRQLIPDSAQVARLEERFIREARRIARTAEDVEGPDRVDRLADALRVWPHDEELASRYEEAFRAAPVLEVAVLDIPRRPGPFVECPAAERVVDLLYLPLLADGSEEAAAGDREAQVAAELRITDIGKRLEFRLKPNLRWNDGSRTIGSADVARALSDRAQPSSPAFDARWANLLDRVVPLGSLGVEVYLNRAPLDPAGWLTLPVGPAHAGRDGLVWTPEGPRPIGSGPYVMDVETLGPTMARYLAADPAGDGERPPISRIDERRLDVPEDAIALLQRGDVAMVDYVPPHMVERLGSDEGIRVGRYRTPEMHWIALDGRNPVLMNVALRRGLSLAIDRATLLEETILKGSSAAAALPTDGPFPVDSFANASDVPPLEHDRGLALARVRAAKQEMSQPNIRLTLEFPSLPIARAVVPTIVESFRTAGVQIDPVERPPSDLEAELRAGRRFDLAYRVGRVDDPLRDIGPVICPGYAAPAASDGLRAMPSHRIGQLLLDRMEKAQDYPTARDLIIEIDRECRDELPIIPLWQIEGHYAWRDRLSGPSDEADDLYEGIESWSIAPWFAREQR